MTTLDPPQGAGSASPPRPLDINNHGQVVGEYPDPSNPYGNSAPFLWDDGQATRLPLVGDMGNGATHVNDRGQVIVEPRGGFLPDDGEVGTPVLWDGGATTPIDTGVPVDLDENGQVLLELAGSAGSTEAALWQDGRVTTNIPPARGANHVVPKDLSDTGIVVGEARYSFNILDWPITVWRDPFVWRKGAITRFETAGDFVAFKVNRTGQTIIRVPDGTGWNRPVEPLGLLASNGDLIDLGMVPRDINDRGQVVGDKDGRAHLWEDGQLTDLGGLGGESRALGINEHGQIIGRSYTAGGELHGVVWSSGQMLDLGSAVLTDINDLGQVIGQASGSASGAYVAAALWQIHDDAIDYDEPSDP